MEWKTYGMKRKLVSATQRVSRLISVLRKEISDVSSPAPVYTATSYEPVNPLASYSLEVESKKAKALAQWHRWQDRPK